MRIMAFGKMRSGALLYPPLEHCIISKRFARGFASREDTLLRVQEFFLSAPEEDQQQSINDGEPSQAGWTFVVAASDPRRKELIEALQPLARLRGMLNPDEPLVFDSENEREWLDWLRNHYLAPALKRKRRPSYVLLVGGPREFPFHFQSLFDTLAHVGRVDFEKAEDLRSYVDKLIRLEDRNVQPVTDREAVFFAPDDGPQDPTHYSCNYMVRPLADRVRTEHDVNVISLLAEAATKQNLMDVLRSRRPAVVYAAGHGLGLEGEPLEQQQRYNGALCCQANGKLTVDALIGADDVPEQPFMEGAVFFHFACHGYGTPGTSDYAHWLPDKIKARSQADFLAALPRRLLAHPHGPIAYIGHVDTAFLHAFADPHNPVPQKRWNNRIAPFVSAVDRLLERSPSGFAMQDMNDVYNASNADLMSIYDQQHRGGSPWPQAVQEDFVDSWIVRSDAQNYMVFGDPAVRLRLPASAVRMMLS